MTALQEWVWMVATLNGRTVTGQPGVRDPLAPCEFYAPTYETAPRPEAGYGGCDTDGHYLCVECPEMSRRSAIERGLLPESDIP